MYISWILAADINISRDLKSLNEKADSGDFDVSDDINSILEPESEVSLAIGVFL